MAIRLVIADDHPLVLRGIESLLVSETDIEIVARCGTGGETLEAVRRCQPDVLILDSRMPDLEGLAVIRALLGQRPPIRVVLHAESSDHELIREAIRLGVPGVVLKEMPP